MQTYRELYNVGLYKPDATYEVASIYAWSSGEAMTIAEVKYGGTAVNATLSLRRW